MRNLPTKSTSFTKDCSINFLTLTCQKILIGILWLLGYYLKHPRKRIKYHFHKVIISWIILIITFTTYYLAAISTNALGNELMGLNHSDLTKQWKSMVSNGGKKIVLADLWNFVNSQDQYNAIINNQNSLTPDQQNQYLSWYLQLIIAFWLVLSFLVLLVAMQVVSWWSVLGISFLKFTRKKFQKRLIILELLFSPFGPIYSYYSVLIYGIRYQRYVQPLLTVSWWKQLWLIIQRGKLQVINYFHPNEYNPSLGLAFPQTGYDQKRFLVVKKLNFSYDHKKKVGANQQWTLQNISFHLPKGSFTTIVGANGCGKSTLLKTIIHHYRHYQGTIRWAGKNLKQIHHKSFAQNVAVINQNYNLTKYPIKVYDFVAFGRIPYLKMLSSLSADDHQIIRQALSQVKISDLADKLVTQLSGGQKQKVLIAMALAQTTDTIILDEPTTFLDLKNQYELLEMLKQLNHQKKTIIAVLHDLNQAITYSDQLILMKDGQIYDYGPPKEVINNDSLNAVFNYQGKLVKTGKQVFLSNIV